MGGHREPPADDADLDAAAPESGDAAGAESGDAAGPENIGPAAAARRFPRRNTSVPDDPVSQGPDDTPNTDASQSTGGPVEGDGS